MTNDRSNLSPLSFALIFGLSALALSILGVLAIGGTAALTGVRNLPPVVSVAAGVAGPAFAALIFAARAQRSRELWGRLLATNFPLAAVLVVPVIFLAAFVLGAELSDEAIAWAAPEAILGGIATQLLVVALLEETGWRGYLTPRLLERAPPLAAALLTALGWFVWHAPKFGLGWQYILPAAISSIGISIIATWLLAPGRGGFLACVVLHACANISLVLLDLEQASMTLQFATYLATSLASALLAGLILWRYGTRLGHGQRD